MIAFRSATSVAAWSAPSVLDLSLVMYFLLTRLRTCPVCARSRRPCDADGCRGRSPSRVFLARARGHAEAGCRRPGRPREHGGGGGRMDPVVGHERRGARRPLAAYCWLWRRRWRRVVWGAAVVFERRRPLQRGARRGWLGRGKRCREAGRSAAAGE